MIELPKWWTVRVFSGQNHIAPVIRSSMILTWVDTYCPSSAELYGFDLRRPVLSIIWGSLWFWPEKARTVHHLGSSIILTWEGAYCPSSGELYDFDLRRHVLSIIWGALWFWPEKTRTVHHLGSYMILTSQIKMIELPRWWTVRVFSDQNDRAPQMMDRTCLLRSKS
jgi:hypothetical protein